MLRSRTGQSARLCGVSVLWTSWRAPACPERLHGDAIDAELPFRELRLSHTIQSIDGRGRPIPPAPRRPGRPSESQLLAAASTRRMVMSVRWRRPQEATRSADGGHNCRSALVVLRSTTCLRRGAGPGSRGVSLNPWRSQVAQRPPSDKVQVKTPELPIQRTPQGVRIVNHERTELPIRAVLEIREASRTRAPELGDEIRSGDRAPTSVSGLFR